MSEYVRAAVHRVLHNPANSKAAKISRREALTQRRRPRTDDADDEYRYHRPETISVHEPPDDHLEDTGLLDKDGNPLMRRVERRPVGFLHVYER